MNYITNLGAALLALLASLPALVIQQFYALRKWTPPGLMPGEAGAVTISFTMRNGNGVTLLNSAAPATASQANQLYKQTASVAFGVVADVQALFTHNWGLDVSAAGSFDPEIFMEPISTTTSWPLITFNRVNSNVVSVNKLVGDAATTVVVTLRRPHSIGQ